MNMKAIATKKWRNGDNRVCMNVRLEPEYNGHREASVIAWRAIGGRFVTAVMDVQCKDFLSTSFDGARRHADALASIGYELVD